MKTTVLLRHAVNKEMFWARSRWTEKREEAKAFASTLEAIAYADLHNMEDAELSVHSEQPTPVPGR